MAPSDEDHDELSRWQLPLRPLDRPLSGPGAPETAKPVLPPITLRREEPSSPPAAQSDVTPATLEDEPEATEHRPMETPDITARFVVAQLGELNERLAALTEATAERTTEALEEVREQLTRLTSLREHDLTEQAAGIFAAVDTGTEAIDRFSAVVSEVATDLRLILGDTLQAIGGIDGLAEAVVQGATDLAETRSELMAGIGRIQRDLATLRKRIPVQPKTAAAPPAPPSVALSDEQVAYIVEAVTEAVVAALNPARPLRRRSGA